MLVCRPQIIKSDNAYYPHSQSFDRGLFSHVKQDLFPLEYDVQFSPRKQILGIILLSMTIRDRVRSRPEPATDWLVLVHRSLLACKLWSAERARLFHKGYRRIPDAHRRNPERRENRKFPGHFTYRTMQQQINVCQSEAGRQEWTWQIFIESVSYCLSTPFTIDSPKNALYCPERGHSRRRPASSIDWTLGLYSK